MAVHIFNLVSFSDGDSSRVPQGGNNSPATADACEKFRERCGQLWAKHLAERGIDGFQCELKIQLDINPVL